MKKQELSYEQAVEMLARGQAVECQVSKREDNKEIVHDLQKLDYLYNLSKEGTQDCIIYCIQQENDKTSEKDVKISFDEAYSKIHSGELVYYKEDEEEEEITTINELIRIRRRYDLEGKTLILYWHE